MAVCTSGEAGRSLVIGVINYDAGNIRSVENAVRWVGGEARLIDRPAQLDDVRGVILPGVGAFIPAMRQLENAGLADALRDWVSVRQRPLLGVCLGMQLLAARGTEGGEYSGLGLVPAEVVPIEPAKGIRVPHVGWNLVEKSKDATLWDGLDQATCYFVHGFRLRFAASEVARDWVIGTTDHGGPIAAMVERANVMGAQFHPEKSQKDGLAILKAFVRAAEAW